MSNSRLSGIISQTSNSKLHDGVFIEKVYKDILQGGAERLSQGGWDCGGGEVVGGGVLLLFSAFSNFFSDLEFLL